MTIQAAGYISQTTDFITVTPSGISNLHLYLSQYPATSMIIANAGSNQCSAGYNSPVTLSSQASSSYNNAPITYQWLQISGPTVSLLSATTSAPSFMTLPITQFINI